MSQHPNFNELFSHFLGSALAGNNGGSHPQIIFQGPIRRVPGGVFHQGPLPLPAAFFRSGLGGLIGGDQQLLAQLFAQATGPREQPASKSFIDTLADATIGDAEVDSKLQCSVCLADFEKGEQNVCRVPCGHLFHKEQCLMPWLKSNSNCPVCRTKFQSQEEEEEEDLPPLEVSASSSPSEPNASAPRSMGEGGRIPTRGIGGGGGIQEEGQNFRNPMEAFLNALMRGGGGGGAMSDDGFSEEDMETAMRASMEGVTGTTGSSNLNESAVGTNGMNVEESTMSAQYKQAVEASLRELSLEELREAYISENLPTPPPSFVPWNNKILFVAYLSDVLSRRMFDGVVEEVDDDGLPPLIPTPTPGQN